MNAPSPAFLELLEDNAIIEHQIAFRVYVLLIRNGQISYVPQPVKVWAIAEALGVKRETVSRSLKLLLDRGYVIETGRDEKGVKQLIVPMFRDDPLGFAKVTSPPKRTRTKA